MEKFTFRTLCLGFLLLSSTVFAQRGNNNIQGTVTYHDSYAMSGVTAYLHDANGAVIDSTTTNNNGQYHFNNVDDGTYTVKFMTGEAQGGVTLSDPFLILQRILNQTTFTNIEYLAANVDGDEDVDMDDYNMIVGAYMNEENPFPVGPWVFEVQPVTLPQSARDGFTTRGTSSGDYNGSLVPDPKSSSIFLTNPYIDLTASPSDPVEFKLCSASNIKMAGMHLVIKIPDGLTVNNVESSVPGARIFITKNQVRVTWINESMKEIEIDNTIPLLMISVKETQPSREGKAYSLRLSDESHFIDAEGEMIKGINLILPTINVRTVNDLAVSAYPNPFKETVRFNFQLPDDGSVTISLFDQAGRRVQEIEQGACVSGRQEITIAGTGLNPGVYQYSIVYSGNNNLMESGTIIKSK